MLFASVWRLFPKHQVARIHIVFNNKLLSVFRFLNLATYFVGSQYWTWESGNQDKHIYSHVFLNYHRVKGFYMVTIFFSGLPHSSHSPIVRGREGSSIVVKASQGDLGKNSFFRSTHINDSSHEKASSLSPSINFLGE